MAAAAHGGCPVPGFVAEPQDAKSAETVGFVMEKYLVQGGKSTRGFALADGRCTDGVARQRSDDRGLHPFAADVADDHAPVVRADLEDVVEVASDLTAIAGGSIGRRKLETRDVGVSRRDEAALQGLGQLPGVDFRFLGALLGPQELAFVSSRRWLASNTAVRSRVGLPKESCSRTELTRYGRRRPSAQTTSSAISRAVPCICNIGA